MNVHDYIESLWLTEQSAYGKCAEVTKDIADRYPELRRVRGHYMCPIWGPREHWWLEDKAGRIIDPTAIQFPSKGSAHYVEWDDSLPEPTGKCPNCGDYCFEGKYTCSDKCAEEYRAYLMGG